MSDLQELAREAGDALEKAQPAEILAWASDTFGEGFCITSSMTDSLLAHVASSIQPGIHVVFLDTGYHFGQTIQTRDQVAAQLPVTVVNAVPEQTVAQQDAEFGRRLYDRDPDLCCQMRKVEPLDRVLSGYEAWGSGVRRDESESRRNTRVVDFDARRHMVKVNPLANWTQQQADDYAEANGIIVNPLVPLGFPSIGCAPCTRPVKKGDDPRAGRWAGSAKSECGLHV